MDLEVDAQLHVAMRRFFGRWVENGQTAAALEAPVVKAPEPLLCCSSRQAGQPAIPMARAVRQARFVENAEENGGAGRAFWHVTDCDL